MLGTKERELVHREIRDQDPEVWVPACHKLGQKAVSDQSAYNALCELLVSPLSELQLKGLVALRTLAPAKPGEALAFLTDRVDEARDHYDPVLLDAVFFAFTALPDQLGQESIKAYLEDPNEGVRSSAAASLGSWSDWPDGTLLTLARDPSVLVRAGLIASLAELDESTDRERAIEALQESPEPYLTALLEDLFASPTEENSSTVEQAPRQEEEWRPSSNIDPTPVALARYAQSLVDDPVHELKVLRRALEEPGKFELLQPLSELCRDVTLSTLLRVWQCVFDHRFGASSQEFSLRLLGILNLEPDNERLDPLREFIKACAQALDCSASLDIVTWSCTQQVALTARALWNPSGKASLVVAPEAQQWLSMLATLGRKFEDKSLIQLSALMAELAEFSSQIKIECPRPERDILSALVINWEQTVQNELDELMGGGGAA